MIKVLQMTGNLNYCGIESVIMNYYRNIDKEKVQFDFVVCEKKGRFDEEVASLGGKIFRLPSRSRHPIAYYKALKKVFKEGNYDVFHCNTNSAGCFVDLLAAKHSKIKVRIEHSHNNSCIMKLQHYLFKPFLKYVYTDRFACSNNAAVWMFGKGHEAKIIKNGINLEKYKFDKSVRDKVRKELGIEDNFVIGHIGTFQDRKNQTLLIDALAQCKIKNAVLILVGEGGLKTELEQKVENLNLSSKVMFLGNRVDVPDLLKAFDLFAFPSKFEGLSMVAIEAQASGLKTLMSDTISTETMLIPEICEILPINNGAKVWSDAFEKNVNFVHISDNSLLQQAGFDIKEQSKWLEKYYIQRVFETINK